MKNTIAKLLALWDSRPRRRIDYTLKEDQQFCTEVMLALKDAISDIHLAATSDTLSMVREFHNKFVIEPGVPIERVISVRPKLSREELVELVEAMLCDDRTAQLDALCDQQYILDGSFIALGFAGVKGLAMKEVHRSNMTKLGADGKAIIREDGKVLKGPNYQPPQLQQFADTCPLPFTTPVPDIGPDLWTQKAAPAVTTQSPEPEVAGTPSNDERTVPEPGSSIHIQEASPNMAGNDAVPDQTRGTDSKPASSGATPAAARMAMPSRNRASRIAPRRPARASTAAAPRPTPPSTPETAPA